MTADLSRGVPTQRNPSLVCAKATVPCGALSLNPQKSWPTCWVGEGCVCATRHCSGHGTCTTRRTSPRKYALELLPNSHKKNEVIGNFRCKAVMVAMNHSPSLGGKIQTVLEKHSSV